MIVRLPSIFLCALLVTVPAAADPRVGGFDRLVESSTPDLALAGEILLGELGCASCHDPGLDLHARVAPRAAPDLEKVGERIRPDYLRSYIADPHAAKEGGLMPNLFAEWAEEERDKAIADLSTFLASFSEHAPGVDPEDSQLIETGEDLYHTIGCVACHSPFREAGSLTDEDDFFDIDFELEEEVEVGVEEEVGASIPFPDLAAKTDRNALNRFLHDPHSVRPSGRMPDFGLNYDEGIAIAAYLIDVTGKGTPRPLPPIDPDSTRFENGRVLFESVGCAACHQTPGSSEDRLVPLEAPGLADFDPSSEIGCLAATPQRGVPAYSLSDIQVRSLRAAIENVFGTTTPLADARMLERKLLRLGCVSCHRRDEFGGPGRGRDLYFRGESDTDLGDEGRIPPDLTGVGAKLRTEALERILEGEANLRPYMRTRMPRFAPDQVAPLPTLFEAADRDPDPAPVDVTGLLHHHRNMYGRELMGTKGLSCVTCHALRGRRSLGPPSVDLASACARLRPEWFKKYLLDPGALRPSTRMPNFFVEGKSPIESVLKGDANHQIEAIWIYLQEIQQTRLPEGMEENEDFEIVPKDRPVVLRTFLDGVGTHAIAVGFPEGVNIAFDARLSRLALAWKGRFLDAESTWSDRFAAFAKPLGEAPYELPKRVPFAALETPDAEWPAEVGKKVGYIFEGYRLNEEGAPTFFYRLGNTEIEETIVPLDEEAGFRREFVLIGEVSNLYRRGEEGVVPIRFEEGRARVEEEVRW